MTHARALRKKLLLVLGSVLVALAVAEVGCRVHALITAQSSPGQFLCDDARLGWRNRPGFDGRLTTADFDIRVRIDGRGHRTDEGKGERDGDAAPGRLRIMALGDSITFGWGVEAHESFAGLLRGALGAEVMNLGVSGYGTDQQLLWLQDELPVSRPDLVVVTHTPNDVEEVLLAVGYQKHKPRFLIDGDALRLTGVPVPPDGLARESYLWRTICKHWDRTVSEAPAAAELDEGREIVRRLYRAIDALCHERGARLLLCGLRTGWLREFAAGEGIAYLDLGDAFDRAGRDDPLRFANDPHWNVRAHAAAARAIAAAVRELGLDQRTAPRGR